MKPTKMRNKMIYNATYQTKSKQLGSTLSKDLHKKYGKKSVRIMEGDNVTIVRGEFKGVDGKISKVSIQKNGVSIEGIKKEKTKGEKFDIYIHTSNLIVTSLNTGDKWRMAKLEGKDPKKQPKEAPKEKSVEEEEVIKKVPKEKSVEEEVIKKAPKETKEVDKTKKKVDEK
jgi:large subunit ribosomal protein L24